MQFRTTHRLTLSLVQMTKLVVYCALGSASAAPMLRLWRLGVVMGGSWQGLILVLLFDAVLVPLVWVGLSLILVRPGDWRARLICALLLCSVSVALGIAFWQFPYYFAMAYQSVNGPAAGALAIFSVPVIALCGSALFLTRRLWSSH